MDDHTPSTPSRSGEASFWNRPRTRRAMLRTAVLGGAAIGGAALLSACAPDASSGSGPSSTSGKDLKKVKVALGWVTDVGFAGYYLAIARGYYADEGLDVELLPGGNNTPLPPVRVASGAADFGIDASMRQSLEAIAQGNDFVILGAHNQEDPTGLISLAKRPVKGPKDLPGLKILSQQGTQQLLEGLYKVNGLTPDYTFVPAGFDIGPLLAGQGDAYNGYVTSQAVTLETQHKLKKGSGYEVATYGDLGCSAYANLVTCKRSFATANREAVVGFMRASARGWQDNADDPKAAVKLVMEKYGVDLGLDEQQQLRSNELMIPLTESALTKAKGMMRMDAAIVKEKMYPWFELVGTQLPDFAKVFDPTVLDEVFKKGPRL
ncbi:ABC transporter substrate-binding protein [Microbacterium sp. 2MCAF23]|uniref:ABC transporter substrate-binding protein n=1 Tax=Microbacterium sp. 2MCAF23 TaxID=3232985 RepID=UPI003F9ADDAE